MEKITLMLIPLCVDCSFDDGLCSGWSQSYQDDFDWTNQYGPTSSTGTGPSSDQSGNGSYMYIEATPRYYGDIAKLLFSVPSSNIGKLSCLKFYYHMYGDTVNTFNVYNGNTATFTKSGNHGNQWMVTKITLTLQSKITFEGIRGESYTGDIAIDDVSIIDGICQECAENVNQSFGRLDIRHTSKFEPYCNWIIENAGIPQAVAVVLIHQMNFSGYSSEYIKMSDGNGTDVFALYGYDPASFNKSVQQIQQISFGESKNIMIQVSLISSLSYVKIDFGILKNRLSLASSLAGWNVTVVNKTAKSIGIIWSNPSNLLNGGIRFYVALARKTNNSSEAFGKVLSKNTTALEITDLNGFTEYNVGVVAADGDGTPYKSADVLVLTNEGVPSRAPNDVRVTSFEFTSDLLVEWDPLPQDYANGKILGYTIYYKDSFSSHKRVNTSSRYSTQFTLRGLKPAYDYQVAVAAFTSNGEGPLSEFTGYTTTGCSSTLNETFGLIELTTASETALQCNWKLHNAGIRDAVGLISVEELNLMSCSQDSAKIIDWNGTEVFEHLGCASLAPEILGVPFSTSNNISFQVKTAKSGNSIKMKFAILKKGLTSAILVSGWNVTISNITSTSFSLQWTKLTTVVNHSANVYIVVVKSMQGTLLIIETVPGNATTAVINRLSPFMKYRVGVFGVDGSGQPYKSLESFTTTDEVFCGSRPSVTRIVGGTEAPVNSWPWQVMITDNSGNQFCGGSLVDPYWIVTAARCLAGETPSSVKIILGSHYRTNGSVGTEQDIGVAKIIVHENYQTPLVDSNDIALIKLASPAVLGKGVGLVCLPDSGHHLPFDNINKTCWITGWGTLSFLGSSPNTLQQASVPLVSKQRCTSVYPGWIDDSMLCAGFDEGGVDACGGDKGGPLVCEFDGTWYLEGVISWGYGCAEPNNYGVYAKVRIFKSWLLTNMYRVVAPSIVSSQNQTSAALAWCNFEHGLCSGWNQSSSDDFDWTLASGGTPSTSTGPTYGHEGSGNYMYIEASYPRKAGENAKLAVAVPNNGNPSCLSFYYHMYGASAGTLNVYSSKTKVFSVSGNQENNWILKQTNLFLDGVVTFEGITGSSYTGDIAIDSVQITEGSCPVSCSFDDGLCFGWSQSNSDVFDWTIHSGSTPSWDTGPSSDLSGIGNYMYIEATGQSPGDNAKLQITVPGSNSSACLKFYYHMYGSHMGTLNVLNGNTTIFTKSGDQGDHWKSVTRTLHLSDVVTFEAIRGWSYNSDIAIDNVTLSEGACQVKTSCDFDQGLCFGWRQSNSDDFDWTWHTRSTPSLNTGPDYDHTSGSGSYMYIETSSTRYGDIAKLEFSVPSSDIVKLSCLKFYYHMYGDTINTLNVYNENTTIFTSLGNQGNEWLMAKLTMILQSKITFEGISGDSYTGNIAIDDVSIVSGICPECTENANQSFGRLDIRHTRKFEPYCKWIVENAGIPQAVAIVSIHQMNFSGYNSEYVKIYDGNGTEVFALYGNDSASLNKTIQQIPFGESKNITIQVSLVNRRSYVKIDYGMLKHRLSLASTLAGWDVTVVNKTSKSIGVIWSNPSNLLNGGFGFFVALARTTNGSSKSFGKVLSKNTTALEITGLSGYTEYNVGVVGVDDDGTPFKSAGVIVMTDEGVPSRGPKGVRVTSLEFSSDLLVEWDPLPQEYANGFILGYTIYCKDYFYPYKRVNTSSRYFTQFTLRGLKPAYDYQVAVAAFTSKGEGPLSDFTGYTATGCSNTFNETFGQIEFTTASNKALQCNWKLHNAGIREAVSLISVEKLNLISCSQESAKIIDGNGTEVLHHLGCVSFAPEILEVPFGVSKNISFQVYTQNSGNSVKMKFTILKKGLTSAILVLGWNVTISNITSISFTLQWTKLNTVVNHSAKSYIVVVKSIQGTLLTIETVPGNATTTAINRLSPSSKYRVSVFGVDSIGRPFKSLESVTTTNKVFCGSRSSSSATRIVGGTEASVISWPWQVMVTDNSGLQFCGGSLVDPSWVVTAAHCLPGRTPSSIKIRLGAHYLTNGSVGTEQDIGVAEIIMHENYQTPLRESNDIALIQLASPAYLGKGVGLVCLPDSDHHLPFDNLNKKCWITGWGRLSSGGSQPNTLQQASVPLVSKQRCTSAFPGYIDDSMLCAGLDEGGVDACQGDSGGPLVCEFNGTWYLEGVTSWGYGCALPNYYGVYAKVRNFKSWLTTKMYAITAPPIVSPQNQSSAALVWCNFENGLCYGWNQSSLDDFDWTLAYGGTPSSSTGPASGHKGSGNFMFIEASYPRKAGENAKLVVTVPNNGNQSCLSFYYHMYGASAGNLNVYSGNTKVVEVSGNQENNWLPMQTNVYLNGVVTFEGITGRSYTSDIAIDSVQITAGKCPVSCSFDDGLCPGWSQSHSDVFDWTLYSGSTPSSSTGPWSDLSGTGKYMYIEATGQSPGDNAKLQFAVPGSNSSACLKFYYHMYGWGMGTLNVFNGNTTIFTKSGDQEDHWKSVIRTLHLSDVVSTDTFFGLFA
ncbi:hypothetical protein ACROYT_G000134 [Oculina patagonica]